MAINVKLLKNYINNGLNVIISGPAGTGKTMMLTKACEQLGLKMKYYSTSTLDPFTDLVGVPVPIHESKTIEYYRPKEIDQAEVVFFDEINRADPRILNTIFEITQFGTINGETLPKLKCVVAAMNPDTDDYTVDKLDVALLDRFDIYLTAEPNIDFSYFSSKYGENVARVTVEWYKAYKKQYTQNQTSMRNGMAYISPRRMEKIVSAFHLIPELSTIRNSLPVGAIVNRNKLYNDLKDAIAANAATTAHVPSGNKFDKLFTLSQAQLRSKANIALLKEAIEGDKLSEDDRNRLLTSLALAFNSNVGPERLIKNWGFAVRAMSITQRKQMMNGWDANKRSKFSFFYSIS